MDGEEQAAASIQAAIGRALAALRAGNAPTEALARFEPARRVALLFTREPRMVPLGRVWRLGVFLLADDGTLYATGSTTRAVNPRHPGYQSVSAEERRGYRAAAFRGPFPEGETVNFDARPIDMDAASLPETGGPLVLRDGRPLVRWSPTAGEAGLVPVEGYLAERVALLCG